MSTNEDASRNCHWSGARLNELQIQSDSNCGVHFPYQFSDVTVSEWHAIDASQFQTNTDLITAEMCAMRDRIAELEGALEEIIDCQYNPKKTLGDLNAIIFESKSLINKGKDNGN